MRRMTRRPKAPKPAQWIGSPAPLPVPRAPVSLPADEDIQIGPGLNLDEGPPYVLLNPPDAVLTLDTRLRHERCQGISTVRELHHAALSRWGPSNANEAEAANIPEAHWQHYAQWCPHCHEFIHNEDTLTVCPERGDHD